MRYLLYFLLLWSALGDFFATRLPVLGYIDEIFTMLFLTHLVIDALANVQKEKPKAKVELTDWLIIGLLGWCCISFLINRSPITQLLLFLFSIGKGFVIFYWTRKFIQQSQSAAGILAIIKGLILIQLPFFAVGLLLYRGGYFGDNAVGAFITGDTSAVATFFWMGIMMCLAEYDKAKERRFMLYAAVLLMLLMVTSTKQLVLLLPFVLLYLYGRRFKFVKVKHLLLIGIGIVAAVGLYMTVEKRWMQNYGVDTTEASFYDYIDESEKLLGYYSLIYELPEERKNVFLWGVGPGMYGSYVAMNARAPLSQKYIMYYYDLIPDGMGGTLAYRSSSIIGFWGDVGLPGLIIILAIYILFTLQSAKKFRERQQYGPYNLVIAAGLLILMQSFILNIFEGNTFTLNLFWILAGLSAAKPPESEKIANI